MVKGQTYIRHKVVDTYITQERTKKLMEEIKQSDEIILFIDEVHTLIGAGAAEGAIDAANILKPSLARGELQVCR